MTASVRLLGAAATSIFVLAINSAQASPYPTSLLGTWTAMSNQTAATLEISRQGGPMPCNHILGTMTDTPSGPADIIDGFYCPATGRVSFDRHDTTANRRARTYVGNLSWSSSTLYIGGTVLQEQPGADPLGEYDFWAEK